MATGWILNTITSLDYANLDALGVVTKLDTNKSVAEWTVAMEHPWQLILIFVVTHIYVYGMWFHKKYPVSLSYASF